MIEKGPDYFKFSNPGNSRIPIDIAMKGGRSDPKKSFVERILLK